MVGGVNLEQNKGTDRTYNFNLSGVQSNAPHSPTPPIAFLYAYTKQFKNIYHPSISLFIKSLQLTFLHQLCIRLFLLVVLLVGQTGHLLFRLQQGLVVNLQPRHILKNIFLITQRYRARLHKRDQVFSIIRIYIYSSLLNPNLLRVSLQQ